MRMLIIGNTGMAGSMLANYFPEADTLCRDNAGFDAFQTGKMRRYFENIQVEYDYIVNCVGLLVEESGANPPKAIKVNSVFPRTLEYIFKDKHTKIIHISTDCVFSGSKGGYTEYCAPDERSAYGASKAMGEIENAKDVTLRTSIIGPEVKKKTNPGLLEWFINYPDTKTYGWQNAYWNGITTLQLAKCVQTIIDNPDMAGLYHPVSPESVSKYRLLKMINSTYQLGKEVVSILKNPPVNKTLVNTRTTKFQIPLLETQLQELYDYCQK